MKVVAAETDLQHARLRTKYQPTTMATTMAIAMSTTVERLDKPSAYYLGRVGVTDTSRTYRLVLIWGLTVLCLIQNKKRKFDRDRDERESKERREEEPDPLKDATTLYVGNLYAGSPAFVQASEQFLRVVAGHSTPQRSKYMSFLQSELCYHRFTLFADFVLPQGVEKSNDLSWASIDTRRPHADFASSNITPTKTHLTA